MNRRTHAVVAALATIALFAAIILALPARAASTTTLYGDLAPTAVADPDAGAVELGVQFRPSVAGEVIGVRFFKQRGNTGTHTGSLWSGGVRLATATFVAEGPVGWQQVTFAKPVPVAAGQILVASYLAPRGHYSVTNPYSFPAINGTLTALRGVYRYGGGYPTNVYQSSNYWVDVRFNANTTTTVSSVSPSLTTSSRSAISATAVITTPATSTTPTTTPSSSVADSKVTLKELDGGADYYSRFAHSLPATGSYFPIAVWYESVLSPDDIAKDKDVGLNTYLALTSDSRGDLISSAGMHAIPWGNIKNGGPEVNGWLTSDEVDMSGSGWWAAPNAEQFASLAKIISAIPKDGRTRFTNFGKGIIFGPSSEDAAASRMVNDYQDIVSADVYWFTDRDVASINQGGTLLGLNRNLTASEARMPSNYGRVVAKLRALAGYSKPVWGFTEVGGPFPYNTTAASYASAPQIRASVWSQIINGARGITYFNHSFGGPAQTHHALRDPYYAPVRAAVRALNVQITQLAPVLNSEMIDGLTVISGRVQVLAKRWGSDIYLFAGSTQAGAQTATIQLRCGSGAAADVVFENRSVSTANAAITDTFADGNAVHIYKVAGAASRCGI